MGFSVYVGLMLAAWAGPEAARWLIWLCLGAAACGLAAWKAWKKANGLAGAFAVRAPLFAVSCLAAALALGLYVRQWDTAFAPAQQWAGAKARIQAQVLDYPEERYSRYYYRLRVERIEKERVRPFTVRLSAVQPLPCGPYDSVECTASFFSFTTGGLYSQRNSRLAGGDVLGAYLSGMDARRVPDLREPFWKLFCQLRHRISRGFRRWLPQDEASFLSAMVLGRRDGLPEEGYAAFQLIGCAHLLVVSGLHMGALSGLLLHLLKGMGLARLPRDLLAAGVLLAFLCVTGFPVSAVRACVMAAVYLLGDCLGRRADGVNSLGLALLAICLQNPFSGGDLGLALSAFATLGILTAQRPLAGWLLRPLAGHGTAKRVLKPATDALAATLSAMGFTLPWQLLAFGGIPLLAPLANLALILPCTLLLYCGFFMAVFSLLPVLSPLAAPFGFCAGWLCRYSQQAAGWIASVPGGYLYLRPPGLIALGFCLLLLSLLFAPYPAGTSRPSRIIGLGIAVVVAFCSLWGAWAGQDVVTICAFGEEGSACLLLTQGRQAAVLALGGRADTAVKALWQENARCVKTLFLSSSASESRQSARRVLQSFKTERLVLPQGAYVGRDLAQGGVSVEAAALGSSFQVLPGIDALLSPKGDSLAFSLYGVPFVLRQGPDGPEDWTLMASGANSVFTVLPPGAIIEPSLPRGIYLLPDGQQGLRIQVSPAGDISIGKEG